MWDRRFVFYLFYQKVDVYDGCLVFMNLGSVGNVSPVGTIGIFGESIRSPAVLPDAIENLFQFLDIHHSLLIRKHNFYVN